MVCLVFYARGFPKVAKAHKALGLTKEGRHHGAHVNSPRLFRSRGRGCGRCCGRSGRLLAGGLPGCRGGLVGNGNRGGGGLQSRTRAYRRRSDRRDARSGCGRGGRWHLGCRCRRYGGRGGQERDRAAESGYGPLARVGRGCVEFEGPAGSGCGFRPLGSGDGVDAPGRESRRSAFAEDVDIQQRSDYGLGHGTHGGYRGRWAGVAR